MSIELKDKLYTSTQVAEILGVSLRTLYRYMEDGRIASMRTASGRHRFTKDQILNFLNAGELNSVQHQSVPKPVKDDVLEQPSVISPVVNPYVDTQLNQNTVDNLDSDSSKTSFGSLSDNHDTKSNQTIDDFDSSQFTTVSTDVNPLGEVGDLDNDPIVEEIPTRRDIEKNNEPVKPVNFDGFPSEDAFSTKASVSSTISKLEDNVVKGTKEDERDKLIDIASDLNIRYYKSEHTDLIRLAKKISEVANAKDLEYAFSCYAGLSLHFLIKPFTILHFYANPEDMQILREELSLMPVAKKEDANIGIIVNTDIVFVPTKEMGGFNVVEDKILLRDLADHKEPDLARQFRLHLANTAS